MQSEDHENHGISMASFGAATETCENEIRRNQPSLRRCRPQPLASPHPQRELRFLMQAPPGHKVPRSQFLDHKKETKKSHAKALVTLARSVKKSQLNAF